MRSVGEKKCNYYNNYYYCFVNSFSSKDTIVAEDHVEGLVPILLRYEIMNV